MLSIEEFKKAFGETVDELTGEQILKLRENQDKMSEIFISMWLKDIKKKSQSWYNVSANLSAVSAVG